MQGSGRRCTEGPRTCPRTVENWISCSVVSCFLHHVLTCSEIRSSGGAQSDSEGYYTLQHLATSTHAAVPRRPRADARPSLIARAWAGRSGFPVPSQSGPLSSGAACVP